MPVNKIPILKYIYNSGILIFLKKIIAKNYEIIQGFIYVMKISISHETGGNNAHKKWQVLPS